MTISAQQGLWSFAPQPIAYRTIADAVDADILDGALSWTKYRVPRVGVGTIQDQQIFPLEVGGTTLPTGAFKQMHAYGGMIDILPRLEDSIGILLLGALGHVETTADEDRYGNAVTGVHTHRFQYQPGRTTYLPWMAIRCVIPGETETDDFGEVGHDVKIGAISLTVPQMGKVAARVALQGRRSVFSNRPEDWSYQNANFEASETVADAGRGSFKIGGVEYPAMGASVQVNNNLTSLQQEMVIGSFNPDDFIVLTRDVSVQFQYKFENSQLAQRSLTTEVDGITWNSLPEFVETVGNDYALDLTLEAPQLIGATTVPHRISIVGNKVTIARDSYPELVAGQILVENYTISFLEPDDNSDTYMEIIVENGIASYAWPSSTNANPALAFAATLAYSGSAVDIDSAATVSDGDSVDFNGGQARFWFPEESNPDFDPALDLLQVDGSTVTLSGLEVTVSATMIGTLVRVPEPGEPLIVRLNGDATPTLVQTLIRGIQYHTDDATARTGETVQVKVMVSDGDGGFATDTVAIEH